MNRSRLKIISTVGLAASAVLWVALSYFLRNTEAFGYYIGEILGVTLSGIPVAFLQLRLCLTDKEKWVRWVPTVVDAAVCAAALIIIVADGDNLLSLLLIAAAVAPTAGICIGWLAHGKRLALIPLNIALIAYLIMNGVPLITRPFELADAAAILYFLIGIYFAIRPLERKPENEPEN